MNEKQRKEALQTLEKMNVIDDFLFTAIMSDDKNGLEVCRLILTCVLNRKIGKIRFTAQKVVQGVSKETHGIRLDAYITESEEDSEGYEKDISVYDVEAEKRVSKKTGLPKRSRYYGDLVDVQLLETSTDYEKMPELVTLFILSYDPFGKNAMYYEAGTVLKTHPDIPYDDGIRRIFLYVNGQLPKEAAEAEQRLKILLKYIGKSTADNAVDDNTRKLNEIVRNIKARKDVGVNFMKSWEIELDRKKREKEIEESARAREQANTERERKRADDAEKRANEAEKRADEAENRALLAEKRLAELEGAMTSK